MQVLLSKCLLEHSDHGEFGKLSLTAIPHIKIQRYWLIQLQPDKAPEGGEPLSLTDYKPF